MRRKPPGNKLRIAFIVNNYPPSIGGVELHVQSLATALHALGNDVLVITLGDIASEKVEDGVKVVSLPQRWKIGGILGFPLLGTKKRMIRLLKSHGAEVVSVHTRFFPMSYLGLRAAQSLKLPIIHTEHGSDHVASDSTLIRLGSKAIDFTMGRMILKSATLILGVSDEVVAFVERLSGMHAKVFYNAIPPVTIAEPTKDRPSRFVFVGRLVQGKGWSEFISLVSSLREEQYEVTGEILGGGPEEPQARFQVQDLGLQEFIKVRGKVSRDEVVLSLQGATLVNPTTLSEGFQTTLLEAIAAEGRVLTYPVPGAAKLRSQGAPVLITNQASSEGLLRLARAYLQETPPVAASDLIALWTWPLRSVEFEKLCAEAVRKNNQSAS